MLTVIFAIIALVMTSRYKKAPTPEASTGLKSFSIMSIVFASFSALMLMITFFASLSVALEETGDEVFFFIIGAFFVTLFPAVETFLGLFAGIRGLKTLKKIAVNPAYIVRTPLQKSYNARENPSTNVTNRIKTCTVCGTAAPLTATSCKRCGSFSFMSVQQMINTPSYYTENDTPAPVYQESSNESKSGKWRCNCGKMNKADSSYCPRCGNNRNRTEY